MSRRCLRPPAWFTTRLAAVDVVVHAALVWRGWLGGGVLLPLAAWMLGGAGLAALALVLCVAGPAAAWWANRGRADARLQAALPGALEAVARSLRSGAGLQAALAEAGAATPGPLGEDLRHVARAAAAVGVVDALEDWAGRRSLPGVRLGVAALSLGAETGGPQARAVDGVATTLRMRLAVAAEARALASQARASAAVIAVAPLLFCGLAAGTDPRIADFLFRSAAGVTVLAAGLLLDAIGALWMARLTRLTP